MDTVKKYPVKMAQIGDAQFEATLVDLPEGPTGKGDTAEAAYNDLASHVIPVLTDLMIEGKAPEPTEADETELIIGLSPPMQFAAESA